MTAENPGQIVRDLYLSRKQKNPKYSTRAFARDLGVSQALLSLVMTGKRPLTLKQAYRISTMLSLPEETAGKLMNMTVASQKKKGLFFDLETDQFKTISNWYHVAILDLTSTVGFRNDPSWISKRLGISVFEAKDALERLLRLGLLVEDGHGRLSKSKPLMYFKTSKSAAAIRAFHHQMLEKASQTLAKADPESFSQREISGITITVRSNQIQEAKRRIQAVLKDLALELSSEENSDEVYHLALQFFPLTTSNKIDPRKKGRDVK